MIIEAAPIAKRDWFVQLMYGLGDTIYSRPHVKALAKKANRVFIRTAWPELFKDLPNVHPINPGKMPLRVQAEHLKDRATWAVLPPDCKELHLKYGAQELEQLKNITNVFSQIIPTPCLPEYDLPENLAALPEIDTGGKPIALIRPTTVRSEWRNVARGPLPEYITAVTAHLREDYFTISVAYEAKDEEWIEGLPPVADLQLHKGELSTLQILELMRASKVVVGGVGFIVPAALALQKKSFIILGGHGGHNAPSVIVHPGLNAKWITFARPDNFCMCSTMNHNCDKRISNLREQFEAWRESFT